MLQRRVSSEAAMSTTIGRASMRSSGWRHRGCRLASSPAGVLTRTPSTLRSSPIRRGSLDRIRSSQRKANPLKGARRAAGVRAAAQENHRGRRLNGSR